MRVVEIVTECEHGEWVGPHCTMEREGRCPYYPTDTDRECYCPGGSRRVLEPGEYVLIARDAELPHRWDVPPELPGWTFSDYGKFQLMLHDVADALAEGEQ